MCGFSCSCSQPGLPRAAGRTGWMRPPGQARGHSVLEETNLSKPFFRTTRGRGGEFLAAVVRAL